MILAFKLSIELEILKYDITEYVYQTYKLSDYQSMFN